MTEAGVGDVVGARRGQSRELAALGAVRLSWAAAPDEVWRPVSPHVDGVQEQAEGALLAGMEDAWRSEAASPLGLVLQGQRGVGKTHLLGWIRDRIQQGEGYFFLVPFLAGGAFWDSAVQGVLDGLHRSRERGEPDQLTLLLGRLAEQTGTTDDLAGVLAGRAPTRGQLDALVTGLWRLDRQVGTESADVARALVLYASADQQAQETGRSYLVAGEEVGAGERDAWGLRTGRESPQLVLRHLSRLLALTGPTVIAIDQVDTLIAQSRTGTATPGPPATRPSATPDTRVGRAGAGGDDDPRLRLLLNQVADGLMTLREETRRTLSVLACLPTSWTLIREHAVDTAADRFRVLGLRAALPSERIAGELVATRLGARYERAGFVPPYPTWPVARSALAEATRYTARGLLQRVDEHIRDCLEAGEASELLTLAASTRPAVPAGERPPGDGGRQLRDGGSDARIAEGRPGEAGAEPADGAEPSGLDARLAALDAELTRRRALADPTTALDPATEDAVVPRLLDAALVCLVEELRQAGLALVVDPPPGKRPSLHARLRRVLDPSTEDEQHWAFRAVLAPHYRSVQSAIKRARLAAGHERGVTKRRLVLLRNTDWPTGRVTAELLDEFAAADGVSLAIGPDDVRTFAALRGMLDADLPGLRPWLATRRPASRSELLGQVLGDLVTGAGGTGAGDDQPDTGSDTEPKTQPDAGPDTGTDTVTPPAHWADSRRSGTAPALTLGSALRGGHARSVPLESLRKHTLVVAGSGSGKTVLLRRLVEECALQGVSAIVLDPNNDLARLGDPWPEPPEHWWPGDAERAAEYLAGTDVVVWTPGRAGGRPLAFQPLPDFSPVRDDPDELRAAVEAAVASLAPRAGAVGTSRAAVQGQAVLREAVHHFAAGGGLGLEAFIELLRDLPEGVSRLVRAWRLAHDMADTLAAATVNDPLFGGSGESADPGTLLTPAPGRRARVSVVSLVGLVTEAQQQSFVQQLQMALFAWVKRHPAGDRPLGGLLVMDEAQLYAPSRGASASGSSTVALASQARKYGLGLVFATQAPRALDNRVPGNAATQLVGFLNSPTQIEAARDLARAKGGDVADVSRLGTGQFYAATEGTAFDRIRVPMCLSHHPRSPLSPEEVVARARAAR